MAKLWFKTKRYGWGWTPASREGWVVVTLYLGVVFLLAWRFSTTSPNPSRLDLLRYGAQILLWSAILLFISYRKGEKPRWRWGDNDVKPPPKT